MRIGELCSRSVTVCDAKDSAQALARLMREQHVGDVIVVDRTGGMRRPIGIVTDRDLVMQVMAPSVDANAVTAGDMMSPVHTAAESELAYDAVWAMRRKGCRRLPVVDAHGGLVGIISADDLTQFLAEELTELARVSPQQRRDERERLDAMLR